MITINDIHKKALKHYFAWLEDIAANDADFKPLTISRIGDAPTTDAIRLKNMEALIANSKSKTGYGYNILLNTPGKRSANLQSRIASIVFDTPEDLLLFTKKTKEFEAFQRSFALITSEAPHLKSWCIKNVKEICAYSQKWPLLLTVMRFFQDNPSPNLPLRMLPIEGIDTKFIEQHNSILCKIIDASISREHIDPSHRLFRKRYRLPEQEPFVECYFNDSKLIEYFCGFSSIALPADQLARKSLPLKKVFVVENRTSVQQLLQYPLPESMIIFGGGFGVALLKNALWLNQVTLYYWGDMDAHGMAILSQVRSYFSGVHTLLMSQAAWEKHQYLSLPGKPFKGHLPQHLTAEEQQLFQMLQKTNQRIEQEQIPQKSLHLALIEKQAIVD